VQEPDASETLVAAPGSGQDAGDAATDAGPIFDSEELTASEAEARRAGQLLDRAFALWEKGDTSHAILACRQSLTLSPQSAPAYSMLGLLLEKTGDTNGAIAAYEKAVEIEPSSLLERDSARRLRASMGQALPTRFHFQEAELFDAIEQEQETEENFATSAGAATTPNTPSSSSNLPVEPSAAASVSQVSVAPSSTRSDAVSSSGVVTTGVVTNAAPTAVPSQTVVAQLTTPIRTAPVQTEALSGARPMRATLPSSVPSTAVAATAVLSGSSQPENAPRATTVAMSPTSAPAAVAPVVAPVATPPVVQAGVTPSSAPNALSRLDGMIGSRSTFWTRSLPLMAVAGTGFLFLLWSRDIASERERRATPTTSTTIINNTSAPAVPLDNAANGAVETQNGVVVANGVTSATNNSVNSATNSAATNGTTSTATPGVASETLGSSTPNAAPSNAATSDAATAAAGANAPSSTQTPAAEPRIAPSGLIVSNAPVPARRASSSSAESASSQRENTPRTSNRRAESTRTRRASRVEERERPSRRSRAANSELAASNSRIASRQPDMRFVPPASVMQLPRAQESAPSAESSSSGNVLLPAAPSGSTVGNTDNGALQADAGPLPSFPSPAQVESRSQSEMRPRPPSSANEASTGLGETAYRYQTRALIHVGQGDNARAADDFQSAMALYRRQIARGENVAEARRGLEACRKGLRLISTS
jgi:hypothetical protein